MIPIRVDFMHRLGAWMLNGVALAVIAVVAYILLAVADFVEKLGGEPGSVLPGFMDKSGEAIGMIVWIAVVINELTEACTGYNYGKYCLGLRAGTASGHKGSLWFYLLRYLLKYVYVFLVLIGLGIKYIGGHAIGELLDVVACILALLFFAGCFVALGAECQALHDKLVGSAVYNAQDLK